jgi:hypothetical protein
MEVCEKCGLEVERDLFGYPFHLGKRKAIYHCMVCGRWVNSYNTEINGYCCDVKMKKSYHAVVVKESSYEKNDVIRAE